MRQKFVSAGMMAVIGEQNVCREPMLVFLQATGLDGWRQEVKGRLVGAHRRAPTFLEIQMYEDS